ncbi:protein-L-isoaspartate O-methyltransferase family protein [Mesorhizobium xinjiangense]|uniref:protein-L-isoaspartate O-methyltransferase family protein n=1 Tax=Mesorhizobium xinjiangense TaxID=2678685 RepID=UPI0012ECFA53|nr:SAM-dependent methyltransferase [Mesorhizobium xinjiangense]
MSELSKVRADYARRMAEESGWSDPRIEEAFAAVEREKFLPPAPWRIRTGGHLWARRTSDPADLYDDVLVALDAKKGINNGEPFLHARWIGVCAPQPGETVTQVGAGTGYYTAVLSRLVGPGGQVEAFEIEPELAAAAARNLAGFDNVTIRDDDATSVGIAASDIVYVNAGVVCPPVAWIAALKPGGRLVFPWRPSEEIGLALLVRRLPSGFSALPFMGSWFIPCVGASAARFQDRLPTPAGARATRSLWFTGQHAPDETATATFREVWFSSADIEPRQ